jgi:SAM-dependent methyltransferase
MTSTDDPRGREPHCRVCGSQAVAHLLTTCNTHGRHVNDRTDTYQLLECRDCTCRFLDVPVDDAYYAKAYGGADYYRDGPRCGGLTGLLSAWSLRRKRRMIRGLVARERPIDLLDVGCGTGSFLASLDVRQFHASGIDLSAEAVRIAGARGLSVARQRIEDVDPRDGQYDVVTLWHVLEHLPDPVIALTVLRRCLRDDGHLVVQVPNADGLGFRLGREDWFHLDSPRHLWLPGRQSMAAAATRAGLRIVGVRDEFYDYPLDLFWSVRSSRFRFLVWPLYPLFKMAASEHLTYIFAKESTA